MRPGRTRCFQLVLPFSSSISNILCAISYARCVIDSRVSLLSSLAPCFCAKERRFRSTARKLISPSLRRPQMDCIYIVDLFLPLLPLVSRVRIVDEDSSIWFDYGPSGRTQGKCEWYASDVRAVGPTATRGIHRNISSSSSSSSRTWYQPIPAGRWIIHGRRGSKSATIPLQCCSAMPTDVESCAESQRDREMYTTRGERNQ